MDAGSVGFDDILAARDRIAGQVADTPFVHSRTLSALAGCELYLKFENLQFTASFKERGALNKLLSLTDEERGRGVIAVSAGNHAQGVAFHARRLGIPATIVMPRFAPFVKVENTERLGADVVLDGDSFDAARARMLEFARERGLTIVHPYDDPAIVAGQGTLALEMLGARPGLDCLVIPVGGGGLIAGIAVGAHRLNPRTEIIGVQTEHFAAVCHAFNDRPGPTAKGLPTIADGIAVERPGLITMPLIRRHVNEIARVSEAGIEQAIVRLLEVEKTVVEGAGAAGLADVLARPERYAGRRVGLVLSGGNIDSLTLADVITREQARTHRLARLRISARDTPLSLARVATIIGDSSAALEEVKHERAFADMSVLYTRLDVVVATRGGEHLGRLMAALREAGFDCAIGT
ncbi:MAG: hypothetical protein RIS35_3588 [Pseudomonadota bacterium]|jgi:threonine dehydratase